MYKAIWGDNVYHISPCGKKRRLHYEPKWDGYEKITFEENDEYDENKYLSFVEGSLKLHKIMAINYDVECLDVTIE